KLLNMHRTTISKWRCYDPVFQAALNARRAEVWSCGIDKLRVLIVKALDILHDVLENGELAAKLKAALEVLRLVPLSKESFAVGPRGAGGFVNQTVKARRNKDATAALLARLENSAELRPYDQHAAQVLDELETQAEISGNEITN